LHTALPRPPSCILGGLLLRKGREGKKKREKGEQRKEGEGQKGERRKGEKRKGKGKGREEAPLIEISVYATEWELGSDPPTLHGRQVLAGVAHYRRPGKVAAA